MMDWVDPTIATAMEQIDYAARPQNLHGLRIGLIENTKKNSEAVLQQLSDRLAAAFHMKMQVLVHKPQRAPLQDGQIEALKGKVDFVITGVGD